MLFQTIFDLDNTLQEGTKNLNKLFIDIGKWVQFYKAAVLQPTYLIKKGLL